MSSKDYEYECMRAELLGLEKPDKSLFENNVDLSSEALAVEGEQLGRVSGGLDELNVHIGSTKKKLTRYQSITGRIGNLIKRPSPTKRLTTTASRSLTETTTQNMSDLEQKSPIPSVSHSGTIKTEEVERQVDKLDLLLMKAEHAEMSLSANNKLIKKIIRK